MELEHFIEQQVGGGQFTSQSVFTVSLEKMLEKLREYQGNSKLWWLPRIIQAAVAARSGSITLKRLRDFYFQPEETWTLAIVQAALLDPQLSVTRSLEHLRRAIWAASWQQGLPFELSLKGCNQALVGMKGRLALRPSDGSTTCLSIEFPEDEFAGCRREYLKKCAHCCPIPLVAPIESGIIGRMDALELGRSAPVAIGFLPGDLPKLQRPGATGTQGEQFYQLRPAADQAQLYAVGFSLEAQGSDTLHWVDDGVIVDSEPIFQTRQQAGLRVWAYASAEGLGRDASGYRLIQGEQRQQRLHQALRILADGLLGLQLSPILWQPPWLGPGPGAAAVMGLTMLGAWLHGDLAAGAVLACFAGTATRLLGDGDQTATGARDRCKMDQANLQTLQRDLGLWQAAAGPAGP
jgi:hypothetical protein